MSSANLSPNLSQPTTPLTHFRAHTGVATRRSRYGVREVREWFFEVWNEPNLDIALPPHAVAAVTLEFAPDPSGGGQRA